MVVKTQRALPSCAKYKVLELKMDTENKIADSVPTFEVVINASRWHPIFRIEFDKLPSKQT